VPSLKPGESSGVASGLTGGAGTSPRSSAVHSEKPERSDAIATAVEQHLPGHDHNTSKPFFERFQITENAVYRQLGPKTGEAIRIPQPPLSFPGSCHTKSWQFPTKRVNAKNLGNAQVSGVIQANTHHKTLEFWRGNAFTRERSSQV
jgi:hypothetical protein